MKVMEFDLEACFNRISGRMAMQSLKDRGMWIPLVLFIRGLTSMPPLFNPDDIKEEKEIEVLRYKYG
jgi:hypothetical protein